MGRAHGTMRRECWEPLVDRPNGATIEFSLSYDADGNVIASAVQQTREHYSEALGTCLANHATGLKIEAPGEPVSLSVPVALP